MKGRLEGWGRAVLLLRANEANSGGRQCRSPNAIQTSSVEVRPAQKPAPNQCRPQPTVHLRNRPRLQLCGVGVRGGGAAEDGPAGGPPPLVWFTVTSVDWRTSDNNGSRQPPHRRVKGYVHRPAKRPRVCVRAFDKHAFMYRARRFQ